MKLKIKAIPFIEIIYNEFDIKKHTEKVEFLLRIEAENFNTKIFTKL